MGGPTSRARPDRVPYLDGVRAVAVGMVLAYHGGVAGLSTGGFYGVDVFFVLSGFLITSLLLGQDRAPGGIRFGVFWARRACRLLPALVVMLAAVDLYVSFLAPAGRYPGFRGDAISVLLYVSNWHFIASSSNYFAASSPSLLTHTWSLAIEEQFYLVWPLVVWAATRVGRRQAAPTSSRPAGVVAVVAGAGALVSAGWMAAGYRAGLPATRLYFGTDTHASSILVGAALGAALARSRGDLAGRALPARPRLAFHAWLARHARVATGGALLALAGLGWAACTVGSGDPWAYQGGFLAVAVLSAGLLLALTAHPGGLVARALSVGPAAYLGRISYGMYLWYFPLFAVVDHGSTGLSGAALFAVRVAADVAVASASHHLVEVPFLRSRARAAPVAPAVPAHRGRRPVVAAGAGMAAVAVLVAVTAPAGGFGPGPSVEALAGASGSGGPGPGGIAPSVPPAPPASAAGGLRLLVTGDSTGLTLGLALGFPAVAGRYGLSVDDTALMGCGLVVSTEIRDHGHAGPPPAPCLASTPADRQWPALLRSEIAAFHPDVVLVAAGRWELDDRRPRSGARWTDITQPSDRAYVRAQLELAASIARSGGARVAVATAPCFSSGEAPDGRSWPADSPRRLAAYNGLVRRVVAATPGATLVDLYRVVCPGGRFHSRMGAVTVRAPDGIHYPFFNIAHPASADPDTESQVRSFGMWVAPRVLAAIEPRPATAAATASW